MNIVEAAEKRYSTKKFDPRRKLTEEQIGQLKTLLRLSPSSVNSQPWHFIIASTDEGLARIAKGVQGAFAFNEPKVKDASLSVVFCAKTDIDEKYLKHVLDVEEKGGRLPNEEVKAQINAGRTYFVNVHRFDLKDVNHWMEKQVYLNMGTLLLGAAALGIDAVPMEGIDARAMDEEFGLREKGFTAVAVLSFGYRAEDDLNAKAPKVRFAEDEIFTIL
ncbi:oxygen-insensitive NAD(P)H nitroreductase [Desulforhopalus vacuolatus]|uniref:oxygen-insensitive NAD(P)H nitroreductase n=1 Tax=Desulforhopalus vacuolatus TaxID=40414 RepID=UPI00196407F0|nr:oxygen-insensitive NAD(P)H nitroreductase [Desulforhopalus vacuolatus]MBM9520118.1 oxygen-insensitive NAD(P)H nitroreductase [Desulforhopalus vacuolatus]